MATPKTITVRELVEFLSRSIKAGKITPATRVYHQTDPEGNGFGTISTESIVLAGSVILIHPHHENISPL